MSISSMKQIWDQFQSDRSISNFEHFYHSTIELVTRIIFRSVQDVERSEDIAQALYARIWEDQSRKIPDRYTVEQAIVYWTFNEIRTAKRRWEKQGNREVSMGQVQGVDQMDSTNSDKVVEQLMGEKVRSIIATLPEKYRQVLVVCDLEGYSQKEAGQILNLPTQTVKTQVNRARKLLEKKLRKAGITSSIAVALLALKSLPVQAMNLSVRNIITNSRMIVEQAGPVVKTPFVIGSGVTLSFGIMAGVVLVLVAGIWAFSGRGGNSHDHTASLPHESINTAIPQNDVSPEPAFNQTFQAMNHQAAGTKDPFEGFVQSPEIRGVFKGKVFTDAVNEKPVVGATVSVYSMGAGYRHQLIEQFKTDSNGCYEIKGLPIDSISVEISHPDYQCISEMVKIWWNRYSEHSLVLKGEDLVLTKNYCLVPGGKQLIGSIIHSETGEAVTGAGVHLYKSEKYELIAESDQNGIFIFENLPDDRYCLTITHHQMETSCLSFIQPQDDILISMKPGRGALKGLVTEEGTGRPLSNSVVCVRYYHLGYPHYVLTESDDKGFYQFPSMPRGFYTVVAQNGKQQSKHSGGKVFLGTGRNTWADLTIPREKIVRGIIQDQTTSMPLGQYLVREQGVVINEMICFSSVRITDSQGRYQLTASSDKVVVYDDFSNRKGSMEEVQGYTSDVEPIVNRHHWTALPRQTISLTVVDHDGVPVEGAKVHILQSYYHLNLRGFTDAEGVFSKQFPAFMDCGRKFNCTVYKQGVGYFADVICGEGVGSGINKDLTLQIGGELSVCLVDQDGNMMDVLFGVFQSRLGEISDNIVFGTSEITPEQDGLITFHNIPKNNDYSLHLRLPSGIECHQKISLDEMITDPVRVLFVEDYFDTIKGRVVTVDDEPVKGAVIWHTTKNGFVRSFFTDDSGVFSNLMEHDDKEFSIKVFKEGFSDRLIACDDIDNKSDVQLTLEKGNDSSYKVYGRIYREDGAPHSGSVSFRTLNRSELHESMILGVNQEGEYEVDLPIEPTSELNTLVFVLEISDENYGIGRSKPIELDNNGKTGPVDMILGWHELNGKVMCTDNNEPISEATVLLSYQIVESGLSNIQSQWNSKTGGGASKEKNSYSQSIDTVGIFKKTDVNGFYQISPLHEGEYSVIVSHEDYGVLSEEKIIVPSDKKIVSKDFHLVRRTGLDGNIISTFEMLYENWEISAFFGGFYYREKADNRQLTDLGDGIAPYRLNGLRFGKNILYLDFSKINKTSDLNLVFLAPCEVTSMERKHLDIQIPGADAVVEIQDPEGLLQNGQEKAGTYIFRPLDASSNASFALGLIRGSSKKRIKKQQLMINVPSGKYTIIKLEPSSLNKTEKITLDVVVDRLYDLLTGPMPDGQQVYFSPDKRNVLKIE